MNLPLSLITGMRLPRWYLPSNWPEVNGHPQLGTVYVEQGMFGFPSPMKTNDATKTGALNVEGRLVLPPLIDAHVHLDKTYTRNRLGGIDPGLLSAISAMHADRKAYWNSNDLFTRSERALKRAYDAGTRLIRSHVDWVDADTIPLAWPLLAEQAERWKEKIRLQRIALVPLDVLSNKENATRIIKEVALSKDAAMGAFIHSSNFDSQAIHLLVELADTWGVDLDLHIDEELSPEAKGLECLLDALEARDQPFNGHIVCGHLCALAGKEYKDALALLDRAAHHPITIIALPTSNLFLLNSNIKRSTRGFQCP